MQSFGFVLTSLCGSTDTAATKEPLGILESGKSSTNTHNCTFLLQSSDFINGMMQQRLNYFLYHTTSGDLRSTTESGTMSFTPAATVSKHLIRSSNVH